MTPLIEAAREFLDWATAQGLRTCLIGGVAVQRWGEPRLTRDVDLTVIAAIGSEERIVDALLARFGGRRPDAREFALRYRVALLRATNGIPLDVALGATDFEIETLDRASSYEFEPGGSLPTCSAEDLVVHKAVAGRPRDVADIEGIVQRQGSKLDLRRIRRWLALFDQVDPGRNLAAPVESAVKSRRKRPERKKRR